jgi:hypothetical protein
MSLAQWVAKHLRDDHADLTIEVVDENLIIVERPYFGTSAVACMKYDVLDDDAIMATIDRYPSVKFVANIPSGTRITAWNYGAHGVSFGRLGDLERALNKPRIEDYLPSEIEFREGIFRSHRRILSFERLDGARYRIIRHGLPPIAVYISLDYVVTANGVRTAINTCGPFDAYVTSSPNCTSISPEARAAAKQAGKKVFTWTHFMGALNNPWS